MCCVWKNVAWAESRSLQIVNEKVIFPAWQVQILHLASYEKEKPSLIKGLPGRKKEKKYANSKLWTRQFHGPAKPFFFFFFFVDLRLFFINFEIGLSNNLNHDWTRYDPGSNFLCELFITFVDQISNYTSILLTTFENDPTFPDFNIIYLILL